MGRTLLVIGNGFDLDLGLKTSYNDFIKTKYRDKDNKCTSSNELIKSIVDCHSLFSWIDIEAFLRNYAIEYNGKEIEEGRDIPNEFYELCKDLNDYMCVDKFPSNKYNWQARYMYDKDSVAAQLLNILPDNMVIFTFNYTDMMPVISYLDEVNESSGRKIGIKEENIKHVHGKVSHSFQDKDIPIILGIDDDVTVKEDFVCMKKPFKAMPGITNALSQSEHVIFFGLGFGVCDRPYFRKFFSDIQGKHDKRISIFTNDDGSFTFEKWREDFNVDIYALRESITCEVYNTTNKNCLNGFVL